MNAPLIDWSKSSLVIHEALAERRQIRKRCKFCGRRNAKAFCDWPVRSYRPVPVGELRQGDAVLSESSGSACVVVWISPVRRGGQVFGYQYMLGYLDKRRRQIREQHEFFRNPNFKLRALRDGTCDAPCCFACRRHVGPGRDYCRGHWDAWETGERTVVG